MNVVIQVTTLLFLHESHIVVDNNLQFLDCQLDVKSLSPETLRKVKEVAEKHRLYKI